MYFTLIIVKYNNKIYILYGEKSFSLLNHYKNWSACFPQDCWRLYWRPYCSWTYSNDAKLKIESILSSHHQLKRMDCFLNILLESVLNYIYVKFHFDISSNFSNIHKKLIPILTICNILLIGTTTDLIIQKCLFNTDN